MLEIRVGMRGIRVEMWGMGVGIKETRVGMQGMGVGMLKMREMWEIREGMKRMGGGNAGNQGGNAGI